MRANVAKLLEDLQAATDRLKPEEKPEKPSEPEGLDNVPPSG